MSKLISFYTDVLSSMNIHADKDGLLSIRGTESGDWPLTIKDLRMTLPVPGILNRDNWHKTFVAFHPLSENVMLGESEVIKKIKTTINLRLNTVLCDSITQLLELAANKPGHGSLNSKQKALLAVAHDVDDKTVKAWLSVVQQVSPTVTKNNIVNIYLRRGSTLEGTQYQRVAVVAFPIMEHFETMESVETDTAGNKKNVYRIGEATMRKKDKEMIYNILTYVLREIEESNSYSAGSNATVAPYFVALMSAFAKIAKDINSITSLFAKKLNDPESLIFNLSWVGDLASIGNVRDQVPTPLPYNDGAAVKGAKTEEETVKVDTPTALHQPRHQPYTATAPLAGMAVVDNTPKAAVKQPDDGSDMQMAVAMTQPQQTYYQPQVVQPQYVQQPQPVAMVQPQYQPPVYDPNAIAMQQNGSPLGHLAGNGQRPPMPVVQTQYATYPGMPTPTSARHEAHLRSRGAIPPRPQQYVQYAQQPQPQYVQQPQVQQQPQVAVPPGFMIVPQPGYQPQPQPVPQQYVQPQYVTQNLVPQYVR